jgi:hypothetical protein
VRSLEQFRKNPHVKIPPKSPPTNFHGLGIFKNQIVIHKRIFSSLSAQSAQRPAGPSGLSAQPRPLFSSTSHSPSPHWASASWPAQPVARRWRPTRLPPPPRGNASPRTSFAPLRARLTGGPHLSSPCSGSARARPRRHSISPPPATTQHLEMPPPCRYSPSPSTPPNPSLCRLAFNGPYKRARSTPGHHDTHPRPPLLAPESATPTSSSTDRRPRFPPLPGHLAAARASVRPEPSSPCSSLSIMPPPVSFRAPEWPEAMLR